MEEGIMIDKSEIQVYGVGEVESAQLNEFYSLAFPERADFLSSNWQWLYRSCSSEKRTPLLLIHHHKVIGQFGTVPVDCFINGDRQPVLWMMDFKLLDEYHRLGLGSRLAKSYLAIADYFIGLSGNDKSIGLLQKLGFTDIPESHMHYALVKPFNYPGFSARLPGLVCKILNSFSSWYFKNKLNQLAYDESSFLIQKLSRETLENFIQDYNKSKPVINNSVKPVRDRNYFLWRIGQSPNFDKYHLYKAGNFQAILSLHSSNTPFIEVLVVSDTTMNDEIVRMIATVGIYGSRNNYSYIRYYTSRKELSDDISNAISTIVRHPRGVIYCVKKDEFEIFQKSLLDIELIDSDYEQMI